MKMYGEVEMQIHLFLIWTLGGGEWSTSRPAEGAPGTHWTEG
jgi:hypothetical protein